MAMEDAVMEEPEDPASFADLSVIFAVCAGKAGRCGIAYVDLEDAERVLCVVDVMDPDFTQLERLKQQLLGQRHLGAVSAPRQGLCVLPSRSPAELVETAARPLTQDDDGNEPFPTTLLKAGDFAVEGAKPRLAQLWAKLDQDLPCTTPRSSPLAALDGNEQLLRAAGGLLRFLEQNATLLGDLQGRWQGPCVQDIRIFSPDDAVFVDTQTMIALQIFQEQHNLLMRASNRPSEGLSLWSLLEPLVASPSGAKQLRRWLQQPSRQVELLQQRHSAVEQLISLLQGAGAELVRQLHRELRMMQDLPRLLARMHRCYNFDNMVDWRSLVTTLGHMSAALGLLDQAGKLCTKGVAAFAAGQGVVNDVRAAERLLQRVVDWEKNFAEGDTSLVHVQSGVDQKLDDLRHEYETFDRHLTRTAATETRRLGNLGQQVDSILFHYFPQLGFHASLPNPTGREAETMDGLQDDIPLPASDWRYQFAGFGRLFYKCDSARRLDCDVGDLVVESRGVELDLLTQLLQRLRVLEPRLRCAAQRLAELDVLLAYTAAAVKYRWVRPKLSEDVKRLHIVKGRHPLVEAASTAHHGFVCNSTEIGLEEAESYRVQVITGANLSGKSVYLKQVGLITYMAQIGCFVPADEAELGLCDLMFSRIQSCETASATCSSFTLDLCQLSLALKHATASSLVLLDEFGKGTRAADGVALLGATIEFLCRWKDGPKALVATHFTEIFRLGLVSDTEPQLQVSHLRVLPQSDATASTIAYLYQLVPGCAEKSFGLECARKAGLDADVLQRAAEILATIEGSRAIPPPAGHAPGAADGRRVLCQAVVRQLCALDPEKENEAKAFLAFVAAQGREMNLCYAGG